ncbi:MAG: TM2 domain-containing protein [Exiguobacterium sp.]|jgi:TM2 domain-containing membrane protein YozV
MKNVVLIILLFTSIQAFSQKDEWKIPASGRVFFKISDDGDLEQRRIFKILSKSDNPRAVAIALNATLGMFGVHRMYLGTDIKVPVIYTVTLGGGLVLWVVDLGLLISTKDIKPYMDNPHVFMWVH